MIFVIIIPFLDYKLFIFYMVCYLSEMVLGIVNVRGSMNCSTTNGLLFNEILYYRNWIIGLNPFTENYICGKFEIQL